MKKITSLLFVILFGTFAYAQCPDDNFQFGSTTPICDGVLRNATSSMFGGEYHLVDVIAGNDYTFQTCGTTYDTVLTVYGGAGVLAFNDDSCGLQSFVSFTATVSESVRVLVDEFPCNSNTIATILDYTCTAPPPPPPNDLCINAIGFVGDQVIAGTTFVATVDGAPFCGTSNTAPGVWYTFTDVSTTGSPAMTVETCGGATYDTKISVYTGGCGGLVCVTGNDDNCVPFSLQSSVTFATDGSSTYLILVHGFGSNVGDFNLTISGYPPPSAPPVIVCPSDVIANNDAGLCSAVVNFADAVAIDPEDGVIPTTQTMGPASGSAFPVGVTIVEFSATDSDGQTVFCQFTVTVNDVEDPTITCPADVVADNDTGLCGANLVIDPPVLGDNCPLNLVPPAPVVVGPNTPYNFSGGNLIDTPSTVTGLSASIGGDVTIDVVYDGDWGSTVEDFELLGPDGSSIFFNDAQGNPDCAGYNDTFTVAQATWDGWITTFGTDLTFTLLADPSVQNFCANNFYQLTITMGVAVSATLVNDYNGTDDASDFYPVGTTTVTWTLTDDSGNMVQCSFSVTVNDVEAPVIVCEGEPLTVIGSSSTSPGVPIISLAGPVITVMNVTDDFDIVDLDVDLDISHTWVGDLVVTIESPAGTVVTIVDQPGVPASGFGCSGDDILATLDDEAADPIEDECGAGTPTIDGSFIPNNPLDVFDGESTLGDWTLTVTDDVGGDDGTLNSWGITYSYDSSGSPLDVDLDANGMVTVNASDLLLSATDNFCRR